MNLIKLFNIFSYFKNIILNHRNLIFKILIITLSTSPLMSFATNNVLFNIGAEQCAVNPLPDITSCLLCTSEGSDWETLNIDHDYDDQLKAKGWTAPQVALAISLLNHQQWKPGGFQKNSINKKLESHYKLLARVETQDENGNLKFNDLHSFQLFINGIKGSPELDLKETKLRQICTNSSCQPGQIPLPFGNGDGSNANRPYCITDCNNNGLFDSDIDKTPCEPSVNIAVKQTPEPQPDSQCCEVRNNKSHPVIVNKLCENNKYKQASAIEIQANMCNPKFCCKKQSTRMHALVVSEKSCSGNRRNATKDEKDLQICNENATEAETSCIECVNHAQKNRIAELEKLIEKAEDAIEENEKEYKRLKRKRSEEKESIASDIENCKEQQGAWNGISAEVLCNLLEKMHNRQNSTIAIQDYFQGVQQQLWQTVQANSLNAFSHYKSIYSMMQPGFFHTPIPSQNMQLMDQLNSIQQSVAQLSFKVDKSTIDNRFKSLEARMDSIVNLNAQGQYHPPRYYEKYRIDLLNLQSAINPGSSTNPVN